MLFVSRCSSSFFFPIESAGWPCASSIDDTKHNCNRCIICLLSIFNQSHSWLDLCVDNGLLADRLIRPRDENFNSRISFNMNLWLKTGRRSEFASLRFHRFNTNVLLFGRLFLLDWRPTRCSHSFGLLAAPPSLPHGRRNRRREEPRDDTRPMTPDLPGFFKRRPISAPVSSHRVCQFHTTNQDNHIV